MIPATVDHIDFTWRARPGSSVPYKLTFIHTPGTSNRTLQVFQTVCFSLPVLQTVLYTLKVLQTVLFTIKVLLTLLSTLHVLQLYFIPSKYSNLYFTHFKLYQAYCTPNTSDIGALNTLHYTLNTEFRLMSFSQHTVNTLHTLKEN